MRKLVVIMQFCAVIFPCYITGTLGAKAIKALTLRRIKEPGYHQVILSRELGNGYREEVLGYLASGELDEVLKDIEGVADLREKEGAEYIQLFEADTFLGLIVRGQTKEILLKKPEGIAERDFQALLSGYYAARVYFEDDKVAFPYERIPIGGIVQNPARVNDWVPTWKKGGGVIKTSITMLPKGNWFNLAGAQVGNYTDYLREKGTVILDTPELTQIEVKSEGNPPLLYTFNKKEATLVSQPERTTIIYGIGVMLEKMATALRLAGYRIIPVVFDGKGENLIQTIEQNNAENRPRVEYVITQDPQVYSSMGAELRFSIMKYGIKTMSPDGLSGESPADVALLQFSPKRQALPLDNEQRLCKGCGQFGIVQNILGPLVESGYDPIVVLATGCLEVSTTVFPESPWRVSTIHNTFQTAAPTATGIAGAIENLRNTGRLPRNSNPIPVVIAGDGGTYDIGLGALSGMLANGTKAIYVVNDNEAYMNTGVQQSSATPGGAMTTTTSDPKGKAQRRKNLAKIVDAHPNTYVAMVNPAFRSDAEAKLQKAAAHDGPAVLIFVSCCPPGQGYAIQDGYRFSREATELGNWPLYEVENGNWRITVESEKLVKQADGTVKLEDRGAFIKWLKLQRRFYGHFFDTGGKLKPEYEATVNQMIKDIETEYQEIQFLTTKPQKEPPAPIPPTKSPIRTDAKEPAAVKLDPNLAIKNREALKGQPVRIKWYGIGGQGAVTASEILSGIAPRTLGLFGSSSPQFGAERTGAPVYAYNILSPEPIREHIQPTGVEASIVIDPWFLDKVDVLEGLSQNGALIVNTSMSPEDLRKNYRIQGRKIFTLDVNKILEDINKDFGGIKLPVNVPMLGAAIEILKEYFGLQHNKSDMLLNVEGEVYNRLKEYGQKVINANKGAIERALGQVKKENIQINWRPAESDQAAGTEEIDWELLGKGNVVSGNKAAVLALKQTAPDVAAFFPITPGTAVAEGLAQQVRKDAEYLIEGMEEGIRNLVDGGRLKTKVINMEGEHSAAAALLGAARTGAYAVTATSSQGLVYMAEVLPVLAGTATPATMIVASRALSPPLSIHLDHTDVMAVRDVSGWLQLFARNAQEAYDLTIMAKLITMNSRVPVMVIYDGFTISHTTELINTLSDEEVKRFVGEWKVSPTLLDDNILSGSMALPNTKYEHTRELDVRLKNAQRVVTQVFDQFTALSGRRYELVQGYKNEDADIVIVSLGSSAETAEIAADNLRKQGVKAGVLNLHLYRSFPKEDITRLLAGKKAVAILDRADFPGAPAGPLFSDISTQLLLLGNKAPLARNYIYGLGGRDITAKDFEKIYLDLIISKSMAFKDSSGLKLVADIVDRNFGKIKDLVGEAANAHIADIMRTAPQTLPTKEAIRAEQDKYVRTKLAQLKDMDYLGFFGQKVYFGSNEQYQTTEKLRSVLVILELERARRSLAQGGGSAEKIAHEQLILSLFNPR